MAQPQDADPCLAADSVRQQRLATTLESSFSSIAKTELTGDGQHGVRLLCVDFCANVVQPFVELPSRKTALPTGCKNKMCWKHATTLQAYTVGTSQLPIDGIVRPRRLDSYAPDSFKYQISTQEIKP